MSYLIATYNKVAFFLPAPPAPPPAAPPAAPPPAAPPAAPPHIEEIYTFIEEIRAFGEKT